MKIRFVGALLLVLLTSCSSGNGKLDFIESGFSTGSDIPSWLFTAIKSKRVQESADVNFSVSAGYSNGIYKEVERECFWF